MSTINNIKILATCSLCFCLTGPLRAQQDDPQILADQIREQVAQLRGLPFKKSISAQNQSIEDFSLFLDKELNRQIPELRARYYGKIVKSLGLYRGPEIEDMMKMVKTLMTSQTGAYYDPATETFYVLTNPSDRSQLGTIYAHELYHGLQDQYWDLDQYLLSQTGGALNDDQVMARQAVVEGEATYLMTLWAMKDMLGFEPEHSMIAMALELQAGMDIGMLQSLMDSEAVADMLGQDMEQAMEDIKNIPPFMMETLIGAYLKGAAFVANIITSKGDWNSLEALYANPPTSTEQILYPEKWLAGENPYQLTPPNYDSAPVLADWQAIDTNVIGEIQWRIIFAEYDMRAEGVRASAGWDGDMYTFFKHRDKDEYLQFIYTCWDSIEDAIEFAQSYESLLRIKNQTDLKASQVFINGSDVLIVEGGSVQSLADMLSVLQQTSRTKEP